MLACSCVCVSVSSRSEELGRHQRDLLGRGEACVRLKVRGVGQASELVDTQGLHLPFKVSGCRPGTPAIHLLGSLGRTRARPGVALEKFVVWEGGTTEGRELSFLMG